MMPAAMENRNDVFITDHGSIRDSRNRAFRVRRATPGLGLVFAESFSAPAFAAATAAVAAAPAAGSTPVFGAPVAGIWFGAVGATRWAGWSERAGGASVMRASGTAAGGGALRGAAAVPDDNWPFGSADGRSSGGRSPVTAAGAWASASVGAMAPDATAADGDIGAGGSAIVDRCLAGAGFVLTPRRSLQDRFGAGAGGGSQTGKAGRTRGCPVCCCSA